MRTWPFTLSPLPIALIFAALLFTACGGGGGGGADTTPTDVADGGDDGDGGQPQTPTQLDIDLQAAIADENMAPLPAPPADSAELVALGEALFFDKIISGNRNISCATCHHPTAGSGDDLSVSIGEGGSGTGAARTLGTGHLIPRNAPPLWNLGDPSFTRMFWDNRVQRLQNGSLVTPEPALNGNSPTAFEITAHLTSALAAQAMFPPTSHEEMRGQPGTNELADASSNLEVWALIMVRLVGESNGTVGGIAGYRALFDAAYPGTPTFDDYNFGHAARAIAAYERTAFEARDTGFDRYMQGDLDAMSDDAKRGALVFLGRGRCSQCHGGPRMTDLNTHGVAVPQVGPGKDFAFEDTGRFGVTGNANDLYEFRTPPMRNVALTGPWMHDGAYTSLRAVMEHYRNPVARLNDYDANQLIPSLRSTHDTDTTRNQARANELAGQLSPPPRFNNDDIDDLLAFMDALTDPSTVDQSALVPASVPSGLPVAD